MVRLESNGAAEIASRFEHRWWKSYAIVRQRAFQDEIEEQHVVIAQHGQERNGSRLKQPFVSQGMQWDQRHNAG